MSSMCRQQSLQTLEGSELPVCVAVYGSNLMNVRTFVPNKVNTSISTVKMTFEVSRCVVSKYTARNRPKQ